MDFRKIFDSRVPPDEFDRWRPRYCDELFADLIEYAALDVSKAALEIGPGTGQATEPIVQTGCSYLAIELGEHFTRAMQSRYHSYRNFSIVNADLETYDFGKTQFDLIYSAAAMQWIPEEIGFPKVYALLKKGGTFAVLFTLTDEKSANEALYCEIQEAYAKYFHPETEYTCHLEYDNVTNYGFTAMSLR